MPSSKDNALILGSHQKIGEADKILTLFSRERGKFSAIAKGACRPTSKFGGRLEIFCYNNFFLGSGRNLDIVSQCETIENFMSLRNNLEMFQIASYMLKTINQATETGQQNPELFDLLLKSLYLLKKGTAPHKVVSWFEVKITFTEGFFPVINKCVRCSKEIKKMPKMVGFSRGKGGILCRDCFLTDQNSITIPYQLMQLSHSLLGADTKKTSLEDFNISPQEAKKISMIFGEYLSYHLGKSTLDGGFYSLN